MLADDSTTNERRRHYTSPTSKYTARRKISAFRDLASLHLAIPWDPNGISSAISRFTISLCMQCPLFSMPIILHSAFRSVFCVNNSKRAGLHTSTLFTTIHETLRAPTPPATHNNSDEYRYNPDPNPNQDPLRPLLLVLLLIPLIRAILPPLFAARHAVIHGLQAVVPGAGGG